MALFVAPDDRDDSIVCHIVTDDDDCLALALQPVVGLIEHGLARFTVEIEPAFVALFPVTLGGVHEHLDVVRLLGLRMRRGGDADGSEEKEDQSGTQWRTETSHG